jgi:tRNA A-37 threonylcarbamoyl transferase component Bud32
VGREIAGRYRVIDKLGEGGMGAVYRGEQISLKRKVAIKVLRPELSADPSLVRRFNAEAELAAKLSHPNTVNIYDFGQDAGGALFIAMEYLEGKSLRQVVTQGGPLPPGRALMIGRQIASSLADAHTHGIVHRDLKPDNVMLTERGKERDIARVLDFGIAKLRADNHTVNAMTRAGDLVGTPQYMAPEQIRGDAVDGRTDVYALGAMLYEMITGRLPFEGTTVMAVLSKHLTETPPAPSVRRPDLGLAPALDALIMSALAKQPEYRPVSMDQFAERMTALIGDGERSSAAWGVASGQGAASGPMFSPVPGFASAAAPPVVAAPSVAAAISRTPIGPPPGVPRSYPPGVLQARPNTPPPPALAPFVIPYPHPSHVTAPRRSFLWLWIGLGVLALAAIGAAVAIQYTKKTPAPVDPDESDWHTTPAELPAPVPDGIRYRDPQQGWSIEVPSGIPPRPAIADDGTHIWTQLRDGVTATIAVYGMAGNGMAAGAREQAETAESIARSFGAKITDSGWVETAGVSRYRAVMQASGEHAEMRIYIGPTIAMAAIYGISAQWDEHSAEREAFFESVSLP